MLKKAIFIYIFCLVNAFGFAQLPLSGDTILYSKVTKSLKELLPNSLNFLTTKSTLKEVQAVFKKAKLTKLNENKNFTLQIDDKTNPKIKYILGGNLPDELIEVIRVSCMENDMPTILPNIGTKTVTDKGTDYWFLQTKDDYKVFFMVNKMGSNTTIGIGIKPKNWVHLIKK
jgi:hypothetical protein